MITKQKTRDGYETTERYTTPLNCCVVHVVYFDRDDNATGDENVTLFSLPHQEATQ